MDSRKSFPILSISESSECFWLAKLPSCLVTNGHGSCDLTAFQAVLSLQPDSNFVGLLDGIQANRIVQVTLLCCPLFRCPLSVFRHSILSGLVTVCQL